MRQEVFDIEHAAYIVGVFLIDGYATVIIFHNAAEHIGKGAADVEVYDILPAGHHLFSSLIAEVYDAV